MNWLPVILIILGIVMAVDVAFMWAACRLASIADEQSLEEEVAILRGDRRQADVLNAPCPWPEKIPVHSPGDSL